MSYRRVLQIGGSYYVSLPKEWVKINGLENSYVKLDFLENGALLIEPPPRSQTEISHAKIICSNDREVFRQVLSAYLRGYEVIEVELDSKCDRKTVLERIEDARRILLGLELVEESNRKLLLQCFVKPDYNLHSIIARMDSVTREMLSMAVDILLGKRGNAEELSQLDDRVDRLYFLSVRLIRGKLREPTLMPEERLSLLDMRLVAKNLENLGDTYESLGMLEEIIKNQGLSEIAEKLGRLQAGAVRLFLEGKANRDELLDDFAHTQKYIQGLVELPGYLREKLLFALLLVKDIIDLS
ncbi:MAG: phosphate uptake regulator PhoU [Thermofilum sp.]|nr:phosphate uptake regulator PhoU [Thermofilum sp.]